MRDLPQKRSPNPWHKRTAQQVDLELAAQTLEDRLVDTSPRTRYLILWNSPQGPSRNQSIQILDAPNFAAHEMRLFYGQGNHFEKLSCGLDLFLRKDGRIFIRFSSPAHRVARRTYELTGLQIPTLPERGKLLEDNCVPEILRDLYDEWVSDCLEYPDCID